MGCGSSQTKESFRRHCKDYRENSEVSTTISSLTLDTKAEAESPQCTAAAIDSRHSEKRQAPRVEYWPHPQHVSPLHRQYSPESATSQTEGHQPSEHPGHFIHNKRRQPAREGNSDRLLYVEAT